MENKLKEMRQEKKISQEQVAIQICISKSYYCNLENNKKTPSLEIAFRLACFFNTTLEELFTD